MAKRTPKGQRGMLPVSSPMPERLADKFAAEVLITQEVAAGIERSPDELIGESAARRATEGSRTDVSPVGAMATEATLTLWGDVWRRLKKNRLAIVGLGIILLLVMVAIFAPLIAPYDGDPNSSQNINLAAKCGGACAPSLKHWFGTDINGRDYFTRVVFGARTSVVIGIASILLSLVIGLALGAVAGYYGKLADGLIMRLADVFFAYPFILGAIVIITVFPSSFPRIVGLIMAIGIFGWATVARLLRASILQVKNADYIEAARALGGENRRILVRHVLPNSLAPVIVFSTIATGGVILTEAALSFLGLGLPPGQAAWGLMVSEGKSFMTTEPWLVIFPGLAIMFTVMGFIFLGDGLRDSMDPRLR